MSSSDEVIDVVWDGTVLEHDGLLWKPKPTATASASEFVQAMIRFLRINDGAAWNPWLRDDNASEIDRLVQIMDQWTRAEPDFKPMTLKEVEEGWARDDEERKSRQAEEKARQEQRRTQYDAAREQARFALLEQEAHLTIVQRNIEELRSGRSFPKMSPDRRAQEITKLSDEAALIQAEVDRLRPEVGDPETVIDSRGRLPVERRELSLTSFKVSRWLEVDDLRASLAELRAKLEQTKGRAPRAEVRNEIAPKQWRLDALVAVPPLTAPDMCADCAHPAGWHITGLLGPLGQGPCPAWPRWAERLRTVREMILAAGARGRGRREKDESEPLPKPQPLAVIPSRRPIAEVISRLTEISAEHPGAIVRRGNANKWEIWPAPDEPECGDSSPVTS